MHTRHVTDIHTKDLLKMAAPIPYRYIRYVRGQYPRMNTSITHAHSSFLHYFKAPTAELTAREAVLKGPCRCGSHHVVLIICDIVMFCFSGDFEAIGNSLSSKMTLSTGSQTSVTCKQFKNILKALPASRTPTAAY